MRPSKLDRGEDDGLLSAWPVTPTGPSTGGRSLVQGDVLDRGVELQSTVADIPSSGLVFRVGILWNPTTRLLA